MFDKLIIAVDGAMHTLFTQPVASRPIPKSAISKDELSEQDCLKSAALMRVNHVGEVCAQALYRGQILATKDPKLKELFEKSGREEIDHLAWCEKRLEQLKGRKSILNPVWYTGAFMMGYLAGKFGGDAGSLGFLAETELQVEEHLNDHLTKLPISDHASRAILEQMKKDEIGHGDAANNAGAKNLPNGVKKAMKVASKVMTTVAYRV